VFGEIDAANARVARVARARDALVATMTGGGDRDGPPGRNVSRTSPGLVPPGKEEAK